MAYDFDKIIDRRNTCCVKWDTTTDTELPMWVADMDFETAPAVKQAIMDRAQHGVFGYSILPSEWAEAYSSWWDRRHGLKMEPSELLFSNGVVGTISSVIRKITNPTDNILILTPIYNHFYNCILENGRKVLESPLIYKEQHYEIDFNDLELKLSDHNTSILLFCNPQNPSGNLWDAETIGKIAELCSNYGVTVISDEIHCDLTDPGFDYTPFASVSELCRDISITCLSPTKTFNLAGIQTSAVYVHNPVLRNRIKEALTADGIGEANCFAVIAPIAAFNESEDWLDALRGYIAENRRFAENFLAENVARIRVCKSHATYLMWLDCTDTPFNSTELLESLRKQTGLFLCDGKMYGGNGESFLRLNLACPRSLVEDGMNRIAQFFSASKTICTTPHTEH